MLAKFRFCLSQSTRILKYEPISLYIAVTGIFLLSFRLLSKENVECALLLQLVEQLLVSFRILSLRSLIEEGNSSVLAADGTNDDDFKHCPSCIAPLVALGLNDAA